MTGTIGLYRVAHLHEESVWKYLYCLPLRRPRSSCASICMLFRQRAYSHEYAKDKTIALNVRLKPTESSAHPRATNYTNVGIAQGIAYVDFGFIEPTLLAAIAKTAKDGQSAPKGLEGSRVAMGVDVLARLHQQIQQVLVTMRDAQQTKQKVLMQSGEPRRAVSVSNFTGG